MSAPAPAPVTTGPTSTCRRVRERAEEDRRFYTADHELDRAKRMIEQAQKFEDKGHLELGKNIRSDATRYLQRIPLEFLVIDPEAIL